MSKISAEEFNEALHHLLWVWEQYSNFEHRNMSAGEDAADFLAKQGLGIDTGYIFEPNLKAKELMNTKFN